MAERTEPRRGSTGAASLQDLGFLLFLGAVWGGAFLFLRIAAPQAGPLWAAEIRIGLAALILLAIAGPRAFRALRGRFLRLAVVGATFSAIPFSLIAFAALTLPAGLGALLNAVTPIFTALVAAAWLGHRLTGRAVVGMGIGVVAVLVLVGWSPLPPGPETLVAVAVSMLASLSYAVGGTFIRRHLPGVSGIELATGQLTTGAILLLPFAILSGPPGAIATDGLVALLGVATLSTALAWPIFFRVLARTSPTVASTVTFIVPAFGITWGALVLSESVGPELIAGFGLVLVSLVLATNMPMPSFGQLRLRLSTALTGPTARSAASARGI